MAAITPLITKADFAKYVDISGNLSDAKLSPRILEAQNFDFRDLVGVLMYQDIFDAPGTYVALDFKPILVYFTAARLIKSLDLHITPNGIMQKRNDYSDHVDIRGIGYQATQYQNLALSYWDDLSVQINTAGKTEYPLWNGFKTCGNPNTQGSRPRLIGIGGVNANGYR